MCVSRGMAPDDRLDRRELVVVSQLRSTSAHEQIVAVADERPELVRPATPPNASE